MTGKLKPIAVALAAGLSVTAAQPATVGVNISGDYVISATGLGSDGFAAISNAGTEADRRLYLYTGVNPGLQGDVLFYMANQPVNEHPFPTMTLGKTDPAYLGTFVKGEWPFPSQVVASYWIEQPTLIASWQSAQKLAPHTAYTIFVHAEPRRFNPLAQGVTPPTQGAGAGVIQPQQSH